MNIYIVALIVIVVLLYFPSEGEGVCCHKHNYNKFNVMKGKRCDDCSNPIFQYCGVGWCNVFGCNCTNGCRDGRCKGESYYRFLNILGRDIVRAADSDGDSRLSLEEASAYLRRSIEIPAHLDADWRRNADEGFAQRAEPEVPAHLDADWMLLGEGRPARVATRQLVDYDVFNAVKELDKDNDGFLSATEIDSP